jgi:hypothetical protein
MKTTLPIDGFAGGLAASLDPAIRAFGGLKANNVMAGAKGALMGAQTAQADETARGLSMTNNSRQDPFALLNDPQIAQAVKSNPTYANALRVGLGLFGATGQGNVAGMLPNLTATDLTGQGVVAGNAGDVATQNRLVSAGAGKTYEPFKSVGDTGYVADAGTGRIGAGNPGMAALFGDKAAAAINKDRNNTSNVTYDPVNGLLVDKTTGVGKPVVVQGGQSAAPYGKNAIAAKKEKVSIDAATADLDRLSSAASAVLQAPGLDSITGLAGAFPNIPGGDAANAKALFDTLKSQIGFSVLSAMRAASKTGGALGAVSDKENEMLQNNLAALSTSQSPEQMRQSLQNILSYVNGSKKRIQDAYTSTYGAPAQPAGQGQAAPTQTARQPVQRAVYNGRVIVKYSDGSMEYE